MRQTGLISLSVLAATVVMELSCLYLGLKLVTKGLGISQLAASLIMGLYLLSTAHQICVANISPMCWRRSWVPVTVAMMIVFGVTGMAVWQVLRADYPIFGLFVQIGLLGLAWWLGNSLAYDELSYPRTSFRFQLGITVLLMLSGVGMLVPVVLFSIMALLALPLSRWENSTVNSRGVLRPVCYRYLIAGSIAILSICFLVFVLLSPEVALAIVRWLSTMARRIGEFLPGETPVPAGPPRSFDFLSGCTPVAEKVPLPRQGPFPSQEPGEISPILIWLFALTLFLSLLIGIYLGTRKMRARHQTRHLPLSEVGVRAIIADMLRELAESLRRIATRFGHFLWSLLNRWRSRRIPLPQDGPVSARALYGLLLRWVAEQGFPRLPSQTAGEYLTLLSEKFPGEVAELQFITDIYVQARYSPRAIRREDFEAALRAWQRVSGTK